MQGNGRVHKTMAKTSNWKPWLVAVWTASLGAQQRATTSRTHSKGAWGNCTGSLEFGTRWECKHLQGALDSRIITRSYKLIALGSHEWRSKRVPPVQTCKHGKSSMHIVLHALAPFLPNLAHWVKNGFDGAHLSLDTAGYGEWLRHQEQMRREGQVAEDPTMTKCTAHSFAFHHSYTHLNPRP